MEKRNDALAGVLTGAQSQAGLERTVLWAADLSARWGVSLPTLWRWRRKGKMPEPNFQGSGWLVATIEAFENGGAAGGKSGSRPQHAH
jgi:predicted DNA-binding transcriptional regulator AlpA